MKNVLLVLSIFMLLFSCKSDDDTINPKSVPTEENYLIFGHYFGECYDPECVVTYKLTDSILYEDINHTVWEEDYDFVELDNFTFEQVNDLVDYFPNELLNVPDSFIGEPIGSEPAFLNIYYFHNDVLRYWKIQKFKNGVPNYLHPFVDKVNEKIELLLN